MVRPDSVLVLDYYNITPLSTGFTCAVRFGCGWTTLPSCEGLRVFWKFLVRLKSCPVPPGSDFFLLQLNL